MATPPEPAPDSADADSEDSGSLPLWARPAGRPRTGEFAPGDVINERFEVIALIGAGGMGEVYRVRDRRGGPDRALKTIKRDLLRDTEIQRRFEQELLDAQQITHRNICRVHDLDWTRGTAAERPFYTMQLLEGETLAEMLHRKKRLSRAEILQVVRGIAAGLDAAHSTGKGVVHRDLKPGNVMVVTGEDGLFPIILDFGISKRLDGGGLKTSTGVRPGTPAYMAPEQARGEEVSPATDVYALARIASDLLSPGEARKYRRILDRALSPDPAQRPPTAGALARALERTEASRRWWIAGSAGAVAVLVAGPLASRWPRSKPGGIPLLMVGPTTISLAGAAMRTFEPEAVQRVLAYHIGRSRDIEMLAQARVTERWKQLSGGSPAVGIDGAMARRIATAEGAPYILFSEIGQLAGRLQVRVSLEGRGREIEHESFPFSEAGDLAAVAGDVAEWLRIKLDRPGLKPRDPGLPELTTTRWEALQAYVRGDVAWQERRMADAAEHLQQAIRLDPEFAAAEARMGDILTARGFVDGGLAHWARAAELVRQRALSGREMLRIRGVFAQDIGDTAEAEAALALFLATFPEDALAHFYYSSTAIYQGRSDQALELAQRAVALDAKTYPFRIGLGMARLYRREWKEAGRVFDDAVRMRPEAGVAQQGLAAIAYVNGRQEEATRLLTAILDKGDDDARSRGFSALACDASERGNLEEAARWIDRGLDLDRRLNSVSGLRGKLRLQAECRLLGGDRAGAARACEQILEMQLGPLTRMEAGCLLARAGTAQRAERCVVRDVPAWPIYAHWRSRLEGEIALAKGEAARAMEIFARTPRAPDMSYWPEFRFRAAMAAGRADAARAVAKTLLDNAAFYLFSADVTGLAFLRMVRQAGVTG